MFYQVARRETIVCPYIDRPDVDCSAHITLQNILHAFAYCANRYAACPIYQKLSANVTQPNQVVSRPAVAVS